MPDVRRTVSSGASLLARLGLGPYDALEVIKTAASAAGEKMKAQGSPNVGWLRLIWQEADRRQSRYKTARTGQERTTDGTQ